jgi:hypothetical protein
MLQVKTEQAVVKPLDEVTIAGVDTGAIVVRDGAGREYLRAAAEEFTFRAAGALGTQTVVHEDADGRTLATGVFRVDCETGIDDAGGRFAHLLRMLHWTMVAWGELGAFRYQERIYQLFVRWVRDHVHTLKGMKYFCPVLKDGIDLFTTTQREDGMIWDNIYPSSGDVPSHWEWRFAYGDFYRKLEDGQFELKRIPVENDVEYLYIEGIYYTWKATGDDAWMRGKLDSAVRAVHYSTSDPYRWSETFGLLKRGFTLDTWDFQSEEDVAISGDAMVVRLGESRFGVMHGDNTGFAASCGYLAEMLRVTGRNEDAAVYEQLEGDIRKRLDDVSWNGEFFTHHVPEDPSVQRDLGIDPGSMVTLSNAYALNRGLTHEQCAAIIRTYQRIRREMPATSPGEFYQVYPPCQKGFGGHNGMWEYMNGGVTTIVAGELAHGAFEHGFERYGVDILRRVAGWGDAHGGYLNCTMRGAMPEPPARSFTPLDLSAVANIDIRGEGAPGVPGWTGEGENDFAEMPTGAQVFQEIPFEITDPAANERRACVGLWRRDGYEAECTIPVDGHAASLYFVHTSAGGTSPVGTITIRYADGTEHVEYVQTGRNIGGWWSPNVPRTVQREHQGMHTCYVAWRGPNRHYTDVGCYVCGVNNPRPDAEISELVLTVARNKAFWAVLGVTLSDAPVFFMPSDLSFGIPDNWGAGAVVYALIEGLAGVKDTGVAFDTALLAPRWSAADVATAAATVKYPASDGYVTYRYEQSDAGQTIAFASSAAKVQVELLLPAGAEPNAVVVDGQSVAFETRTVEQSRYATLTVKGLGAHDVELRF